VTALWWAGTRGLTGAELVTARFDALKVGLSIGVGSGGLFALYLAWRRQRSTEADLDNRERALAHQLQVAADTKAHQERVAADTKAHQERVAASTEAHQERVAAATEADAEARRITDLYTKAVEQLGSDKAPVRLGGLYALERLAQENKDQRQTIVNVLCAYLRMPYTPPTNPPPNKDEAAITEHQQRVQEREVRVAAQRILATRLRPGPDTNNPVNAYWHEIDLDFTGATLINLDFTNIQSHKAQFDGATFTGNAGFDRATFTGNAGFTGATFTGDAWFEGATFTGDALFDAATFTGDAGFDEATLSGNARFRRARFDGDARFHRVTWPDTHFADNDPPSLWTDFTDVRFAGDVPPEVARFVSPPPDGVEPAMTEVGETG
jgi:uncharacterized protein YjbI with pentapeptide repeats